MWSWALFSEESLTWEGIVAVSLCPCLRGGCSSSRTASGTGEEAFSSRQRRQPGPGLLLVLLYQHSGSASGAGGSKGGPKQLAKSRGRV